MWWTLGVLIGIAVLIVSGLLAHLRRRPLSRELGRVPPPSPAPDKGGNAAGNRMPFALTAIGLGCLALVAGGIVWFMWSHDWQPGLADVAHAVRTYFFLIAGVLGVMYAAGTSLPKAEVQDGKKEAKALCHVLHGSAIVLAVFLFVAIPFGWAVTQKTGPVTGSVVAERAAMAARSQCPGPQVVNLSPSGDSSALALQATCRPRVSGSAVRVTCVYSDGSKGIIGDSSQPCHAGPIAYVQLSDLSGRPNTALYEQVP